jgi:hypothetical protein
VRACSCAAGGVRAGGAGFGGAGAGAAGEVEEGDGGAELFLRGGGFVEALGGLAEGAAGGDHGSHLRELPKDGGGDGRFIGHDENVPDRRTGSRGKGVCTQMGAQGGILSGCARPSCAAGPASDGARSTTEEAIAVATTSAARWRGWLWTAQATDRPELRSVARGTGGLWTAADHRPPRAAVGGTGQGWWRAASARTGSFPRAGRGGRGELVRRECLGSPTPLWRAVPPRGAPGASEPTPRPPPSGRGRVRVKTWLLASAARGRLLRGWSGLLRSSVLRRRAWF